MNKEFKDLIKELHLHQYQVADICGISETTLVRWLRYKLDPEKRTMILSAIKKGISEPTRCRMLRNELPAEEQERICKLIDEYAMREAEKDA